MRTYKAIIFDLGKVVFDVSFDRAFAHWAQVTQLDTDTVRRRFRFDEAYGQFSENRISGADYAQHVSKLLERPLSESQFEKGWNDIYLELFPDIDELLVALKKNYRVVALTNTNPTHAKVWPVKYADTLQHFEKIFSSHEMGARKPEKRAYQTVLDYLDITADEALFLDDTPPNVIGAEDAGIKGIIVTSFAQMKDELKKAGINLE